MPSFTTDRTHVLEGWVRSRVEQRREAPGSLRKLLAVLCSPSEMIARIVFASSLELNEVCTP
jgi:predicted ester cyclase